MPSQSAPYVRACTKAANQDDVLLVRDADRLGLTEWDIRALREASPFKLYGALAVPPVRDPLRSQARAAQLLLPNAVISHLTDARLHGLEGLNYPPRGERIDATLPPTETRWQRAGIRLHFQPMPVSDVMDLGGLRMTTVRRTLADCATVLDRVRLISIVDSALNLRLITVDDRDQLVVALGRRKAAGWVALSMPGAESPSESIVRLTLADAGLTPDHLQYEVFTEGGFFVARLDMAYTRDGKKVGMEVDSGEHDRVKALYRDRDRLNALRSLGWDVRQVTQHDAHHRPGYVVQQAAQALSLQETREIGGI
jgi:hypothetical protein